MRSSAPGSERTIIDGRFEQLKVLGSGGGGEVLLVRDLKFDQLLALKLLYPHLAFSEASFARFRTEARVTMQLSHPNILPTYGMERTSEGVTYLKMAYIEGAALDRIIRERPGDLAVEFVIDVVRSVAEGLLHAHQQGIIHRDLKPANVLIADDGSIKVADFGVAYMIRAEVRHTQRGNIVGTPQYMAPETLAGELPDSRSDIYALGMLAYEMCAGRPAFSGDTFWELADRIMTEEPVPIESLNAAVPAELAVFIARCLEKVKQRRYDDLKEALRALPGGSAENRVEAQAMVASARGLSTHGSALGVRTQQYAKRLVISAFALLLTAVILIAPWVNSSAAHFYSIAIVRLELSLGTSLPVVRSAFNSDPRNRWPDVAFFGPSRSPTGLAFVRAGYDLNRFSPQLSGYPIHGATLTGDFRQIEAMVARKVDLDALDSFGSTALVLAIVNRRGEIADLLIEVGASVSIADSEGRAPLHHAAAQGWTEMVKKLLEAGASPHQIDGGGNTPLHEAARSRVAGTISELLSHGADPRAENLRGELPALAREPRAASD